LHRRYIINSLIDQGINFDTCIFQKKSCSPKFDVKPKWSRVEKLELTKKFKSKTRMDLKRVKKIIEINKLQSKDFKFKKEILEANFVIVSGADWIKGYLLKIIKHKSLNIHMGIAEKYRGLDSNLWAWYHKDFRNIGVTLHKLDNDLDSGLIFRSQRLKLNKNQKVWLLRYLESELAIKLLKQAINNIRNSKLKFRKQKFDGRYYSFMPSVIKNSLKQQRS